MNDLSQRPILSDSALDAQRLWVYGMSLVLALWLGATVLLDFVIMPNLADAGMMNSSSFIPAGFGIFHQFNGLEVMAGSMAITGAILLLRQSQLLHPRRLLVISGFLFVIPLVYFYYLGPEMAGIGLTRDLVETNVSSMNLMHILYWGLDLTKILCVAMYLNDLWSFLKKRWVA